MDVWIDGGIGEQTNGWRMNRPLPGPSKPVGKYENGKQKCDQI